MEFWEAQINKFPGWQVHMGSTCSGIMTFFAFLFFLELIRNEVTLNSVASKCTVVASRWAHLVGNNRPYPLLHCDPGRNHLRRMGLPPNF